MDDIARGAQELRLLFVEDSDDDRELLVRELARNGYRLDWEQVQTAAEMHRALAAREWDVVIADYSLPEFNAPAALRLLQGAGVDIPFIIVSGTVGEEAVVAALKAGAHDFIMKGRFSRLVPAIERELREARERRLRRQAEASWQESELRFTTAFERSPNAMSLLDAQGRFMEVNKGFLALAGIGRGEVLGHTAIELGLWADEDEVLPIAAALHESGRVAGAELRVRSREGELRTGLVSIETVQMNEQRCLLICFQDITERKAGELALEASYRELSRAYDTTLTGWAHALELRDAETQGHSQRVTGLTMQMASAAGLSDDELIHVRRGALLHDIGKMGVPDRILLKPEPLNDAEWGIMRMHPLYAYEMLHPIEFLRPALEIPLHHHERWDGTGYPAGLRGEEIPFAARLFAVVDVWDALSTARPYKEPWPAGRVLAHIRGAAGTHFDPYAVSLFEQALAGAQRLAA